MASHKELPIFAVFKNDEAAYAVNMTALWEEGPESGPLHIDHRQLPEAFRPKQGERTLVGTEFFIVGRYLSADDRSPFSYLSQRSQTPIQRGQKFSGSVQEINDFVVKLGQQIGDSSKLLGTASDIIQYAGKLQIRISDVLGPPPAPDAPLRGSQLRVYSIDNTLSTQTSAFTTALTGAGYYYLPIYCSSPTCPHQP